MIPAGTTPTRSPTGARRPVGPWPFLLLACLALWTGTGCALQEDVAQAHDLYSETRSVLIAHVPAFHDTKVPLKEIPAGQAHWITVPREVHQVLEAMTFEPMPTAPADVKPVFALVFVPEDIHSRLIFYLDKNLNLLPGFTQHGARYSSQFYRTSDRFKELILERIESCPDCRAYHPVLAREFPVEEEKPAKRRRRR